jgi:hypothetical protein
LHKGDLLGSREEMYKKWETRRTIEKRERERDKKMLSDNKAANEGNRRRK